METVTITNECEARCKQLGEDYAITLEIRATEKAISDGEYTVTAEHVDQAAKVVAWELLSAIDEYVEAACCVAGELACERPDRINLPYMKEDRQQRLADVLRAFHRATGFKVVGAVPAIGMSGSDLVRDGIAHGGKACNVADVMPRVQ